MSDTTANHIDEGRLDLVPMIDCIMLLLLFFMLTVKFKPDEEVLSHIMPTQMGSQTSPPVAVDPLTDISIQITPAGPDFQRGGSEASYQSAFITELEKYPDRVIEHVNVRVGNRPNVFTIDLAALRPVHDSAQLLAPLHGFIARELVALESPGQPRHQQRPVRIQCFSGLSWQCALVTYDGVRAYESSCSSLGTHNRDGQFLGRQVVMGLPPADQPGARQWGAELFDLLHAR